MDKLVKFKKGFSLIELLAAIVIIAIVTVSLPTVFSVLFSNIQRSLEEEAIYNGYSAILGALTYYWDENLTDDRVFVLNVNGGNSKLDRKTPSSNHRIGHFEYTKRRKFFDYTTNRHATAIGLDSGENANSIDDIDDFDNITKTYTSLGGSSSDFILNISTKFKVLYVSDNANYSDTTISYTFPTSGYKSASHSTNIKMIEAETINNDTRKTILLLRAYKQNIGGQESLYKTCESSGCY
jgi:prepilin-type N-terminal cleavage/methylation domain-containing protein